MCRNVADRPDVPLEKSSRLHSKLDGYSIYSFTCKQCGWKSGDILVQIELSAVNAQMAVPAVIIPTEEESAEVLAKPKEVRPQRIIMPEAKPVDPDELHAFVNEKFPLEIQLADGKRLKRKVERTELPGAGGVGNVGVVKLIYSEGTGTKSEFGFFYAERNFFCTNGFPDPKEVLAAIYISVDADLKVNNPKPTRVAPVVTMNRGRSRLRTVCGECGSSDGDCGCPGMLKNVRNPAGMAPPDSLLVAPDGSPVTSLQERLDPGSKFGV